jgi:hypothetical protein
MGTRLNRRGFLRKSTILSAAALAGPQVEQGAEAAMPSIRLGRLEVSRLLLGSNQFFGYAHGPESLAKQMRAYFTAERIMSTLDQAAGHGITAVVSPPDPQWLEIWSAYRQGGGGMPHWIAQVHRPADNIPAEIDQAAEAGAAAIFIQGERVDEMFSAGRLDDVRGWIERIIALGLPAGMATHRPDVNLLAQERGFANDFFFQCLYPDDNFHPADRDRAALALAQLEKPAVAYKVLAAGRLEARDGYAHIGRYLRPKDGVCVGIYPRDDPHQIRINAQLARALPGA